MLSDKHPPKSPWLLTNSTSLSHVPVGRGAVPGTGWAWLQALMRVTLLLQFDSEDAG